MAERFVKYSSIEALFNALNQGIALANQKSTLADQKATLADQKAALADGAATSANNAAAAATTAKQNADTATTAANTATSNANTATTQANAARDAANTAKQNADAATTAANTATTQANAARDAANTAKQNADTATTAANTAAGAANTAAGAANTAAGAANTAKTNADTATGNANTATTAANTAAGYATTQGDYAKAQGDYAKAQGNAAATATANVGDMKKATYDPNGDGKVAAADVADLANAVAWANVTGKPATFPPSAHSNHVISDVANLQSALDAKATVANAALTGTTSAQTLNVTTQLGLPGGTNHFMAGPGDNATYATHNTALKLWYGLGIKSFDDTVTAVLNARTGTWRLKGGVEIGPDDATQVKLNMGSNTGLKVTTAGGWVEIGAMNTTYAHIYTDRSGFYLNKSLTLEATSSLTIGNTSLSSTGGYIGAPANTIWHAGNFQPGNYAPLASPTFTGAPAAPTAAAGTNTTQLATTAFVTAALAARTNQNLLSSSRPTFAGLYSSAGLSTGIGGLDIHRDVVGIFGGGSATGTLKITLPTGWTNNMQRLTIRGYDYSAAGAWEVVVSGYDYVGTGSGGSWINTSAEIRGVAPFSNVRLAYDGTKVCVLLGSTGTIWSYARIYVAESAGGNNAGNHGGNSWGMSFITNESGLSAIVQPAIYQRQTTTDLFLNSAVNVASTLKVGAGWAGNAGIEVGTTTTASTPFLDFHSSGTSSDYDARIMASGGGSTAGQGSLSLTAAGGIYLNGPTTTGWDLTFNAQTAEHAVRFINSSNGAQQTYLYGNTSAGGTLGIYDTLKGMVFNYTRDSDAVSINKKVVLGQMLTLDPAQSANAQATLTTKLNVNRNTAALSAESYYNGHMELRSSDGSPVVLGFHRSGHAQQSIVLNTTELGIWDGGNFNKFWHAGNFNPNNYIGTGGGTAQGYYTYKYTDGTTAMIFDNNTTAGYYLALVAKRDDQYPLFVRRTGDAGNAFMVSGAGDAAVGRNLTAGGSITASGTIIAQANGQALYLNGTDHMYMGFYRAGSRKGYLGFPNTSGNASTDNTFTMVNEWFGTSLSLSSALSSSHAVYAPDFIKTSTRASKQDIAPYEARALAEVEKLDIVTFRYKAAPEVEHVGIIADDTENTLIAGEQHDGFNTANTLAIALKAIQELMAENRDLQARVAALEAR